MARTLFCVLVGQALVVSIFAGTVRAQSVEEGARLFEGTCMSCHTIGGGDRIGPDLEGVTDRNGREATIDFIVEPSGAMPNLGIRPDQAADVAAFIEAQSGEAPPGEEAPPPEEPPPAAEPPPPVEAPPEPAEPAPTPPGGGDPDAGGDLFTGVGRFENGGASCLSCHQIAGAGSLGGGTLGPDLTGAYEKYGAGFVGLLGSGTMAPVFEGKPLTAREEADLGAFLALAAFEEPPSSGLALAWFVLIGLGGAAVLFGLALIVWRDRLGSVRRALVRDSSTRKE